MSCEKERGQIQAFVDGTLPDRDIGALRDHCMHCRSCAKYLREMDAVKRAVKSLADEPVPEDLHEKIMAVCTKESSKKTIRFQPGVLIAAAATVVVLVGAAVAANAIHSARDNTVSATGGKAQYAVSADGGAKNQATTKAATAVAGGTSVAAQTTIPRAEGTVTNNTAETVGLTGSMPTATGRIWPSETVSESELQMLRDEAARQIPQGIDVSEPYSFIIVVRASNIPLEFNEWKAQDISFDGENVTCLSAVLTAERILEILDATSATGSYYCEDPGLWDALDPSVEKGLFLMIVPQGT